MATKIKTIFPPNVPSFLPAFGKDEDPKFYFKPSIANTIKQIGGVQLIISRQDSNESILSQTLYPFGLIFVKFPEEDEDDELTPFKIRYDEEKKYYYFRIDKKIFPEQDVPYKLQIRVSSVEAGTVPADNSFVKAWLDDNLDHFSEWSTVTIMMPITPPDFGLTGLTEGEENNINSSGFNFVGYYNPQDANKREILYSYRMNIYEYQVYEDKSTWRLYSTSGEETIGIYEKVNIEHTFNKDLDREKKYVITFTIKSKNLYTKTKFYKITPVYPTIELYNSINLHPVPDEGKIRVDIQAKQILMKPTMGSFVSYLKNEVSNAAGYDYGYAAIKGSIESNENFSMNADDDKWVLQARVIIPRLYDNPMKAYENPFITMTDTSGESGDKRLFSRIKLCGYKINLNGYPVVSGGRLVEQSPNWEYRIVARKETVAVNSGREEILLTQDKVFRSKQSIGDSEQEYYIYLKEDQGLMELSVMKAENNLKGVRTWLQCLE